MKGTFKATWHQSKNKIYVGDGADKDMVELLIEIEEVTPLNLKKLKDSLEKFQVTWF